MTGPPLAAAVTRRLVVEQACGAVAESSHLCCPEALAPVRLCADVTGLPLVVIARALVQHPGDVEWLRGLRRLTQSVLGRLSVRVVPGVARHAVT